MNWQFTPYTLPCLITAMLSCAVVYMARRHRSTQGALALACLSLAVTEWSLGYALELASADLAWELVWAKIEYLGIGLTPVAWFAFTLQYADWRDAHGKSMLTRRTVAGLTLIPLATLILALTNDWHGLLWSQVRQATHESFVLLDLTHGTGFWIYMAYAYLLLLLGTGVLLWHLAHSARYYRGHMGPMLIAVAVPWFANATYAFGASPFPHLDLTPFAFTLSALAISWSIFRRDLLDITPIARDTIIEGMTDGVIVVDLQGRVVDINPAAQRMIKREYLNVIGQQVEHAFAARGDLVERYRGVSEIREEITDGEGTAKRIYEVQIAPLLKHNQLSGRLITLRDVTQRKQTEEALKASEQYARSIIASSLDMIVTTDNERRIVEFNRAAQETFGYTREEVIGKSVGMLYSDAASGIAIREAMLKQGNYVGEVINLRKNGEPFTSLISATPLRGVQGENLGTVGVSRDITERIQAEQALRQAEEKYRTIFESTIEGIFQSTPEGRFVIANPALAHMWGYDSPQDLIANVTNIAQQIYADPNQRAEFQRIMREYGEVQGFEFQARRKDGTLMWTSENAHAVRDANGTLLYFEGTAEDITATKEAQQALLESEARFKSLFEESPISLWEEDFSQVVAYLAELRQAGVTDLATYFETHPEAVPYIVTLVRVIDINKATLNLYQAQSKEQFLSGLGAIASPQVIPAFTAELLAIAEGKTHFECETVNRTMLGNEINVLLAWSVMPGNEKTYAQVFVSVNDISERKRNENKLRESEALYHSLVEALPINLCRKDLEGRFVFANSRYCHTFNKTFEEIVGKTDWDLYPAEFAEKYRRDDLQVMTSGKPIDKIEEHLPLDGEKTYVQSIKTPLRDAEDKIVGIQILFWDVTERFKSEERLRYLSTHDALTGIYNRAFFETELARLESSREFPMSMVVADLDNMKTTNDKLGHAAGDELLKRAALVLQAAFRAEDIIARIGGDEFAIILPATNATTAEQVLKRIHKQIAIHNAKFPDLPVQLSMGVATAVTGNLADTFKLADERMYADKLQHKQNGSVPGHG